MRTSSRHRLEAMVHRPGASLNVLPVKLLLNRAMAGITEIVVGTLTVGEQKCYRAKTMPQQFSDPGPIQSAIMLDCRRELYSPLGS
jgi:hypothetical protein